MTDVDDDGRYCGECGMSHDNPGSCREGDDMKNDKVETPWAILFLREQDGAKEVMDKMVASMEDVILHGTDDENDDVLATLRCYAAYAEVNRVDLPAAINRLGMMAGKRHIKADRDKLIEILGETKGDKVAKAVRNLIDAVVDSETGGELSEESADEAIASIQQMLGLREADGAD